jgi:hypothetical protein
MAAYLNDSAHFADIWAEAIKEYKKQTKVSLKYTIEDFDSPSTVLAYISDEHEKFQEYRKKGERLRNVAQPVMIVVGKLADTAAEGISLVSFNHQHHGWNQISTG